MAQRRSYREQFARLASVEPTPAPETVSAEPVSPAESVSPASPEPAKPVTAESVSELLNLQGLAIELAGRHVNLGMDLAKWVKQNHEMAQELRRFVYRIADDETLDDAQVVSRTYEIEHSVCRYEKLRETERLLENAQAELEGLKDEKAESESQLVRMVRDLSGNPFLDTEHDALEWLREALRDKQWADIEALKTLEAPNTPPNVPPEPEPEPHRPSETPLRCVCGRACRDVAHLEKHIHYFNEQAKQGRIPVTREHDPYQVPFARAFGLSRRAHA